MRQLIAAFAMLAACVGASAAEVAGVKLEDTLTVGGAELVLNGAGARKRFGFANVYVAALYLPSRTTNADAVIAAEHLRRVLLVMKRSVESESMLASLHEALRRNNGSAEMEAIAPQLAKLDAIFLAIKSREGDRIALDFGKDGSVTIFYNDQPQGMLNGPGIGPALLKVWLGSKPVQEDLKRKLLAG
jgi:hypothetical protein